MTENPSQASLGKRRTASVVDLTFAIWALLIPLLVHGRLLNGDGDLPRHLSLGEQILREGPRFTDVFSFTRAGEPFLAYEWGSQTLLYLVFRIGGLPSVAVFAGLILAGALALTVAYVRRDGGDPWLAFMVGALAAVLTGPHWIARPHLFTLLALPCLLLLADARRPRFLLLGLLFAAWANLHPGFLYGLVILGVIFTGRLAEKWWAGSLEPRDVATHAGAWIVAAGSSLLNPFGWSLHTHALSHAADTELVGLVQEFLPLNLLSGYGILFMATVGLVTLGLSAQSRRAPLDALGAFLAGMFATVLAQRNGPLMALSGLPMITRALTPVVAGLPDGFLGRMRGEFRRSDGSSRRASLVALIALVLIQGVGGRVGPVTLIPGDFSGDAFPVEAVARAREAGLSGRLLSDYEWGGYIVFAWPGQRIFVDSMADFFGKELVYEFALMRDAGPGWRDRLATNRISLVLMSPGTPLVGELRGDPGWTVWHEDGTAVLLVREGETPSLP